MTTAMLDRDRRVSLARAPSPPAPAAGQVLVAMRFAPVNPADLLMIDGRYAHQPSLPCALGAEGAGRVVAIGRGVERLAVGDDVIPLLRGNWASHRLLAEDRLVRVPPALSPMQAAMLRINPATAARLVDLAPAGAPGWLVQNGARGSVGGYAAAIARGRGARVLNVVRRADGTGDNTIEDGDDLPRRIRAIVGDAPIPLALDAVAGAASGRLAACLSPGGVLAVYGHLSGAPCSIPSALLTAGMLSVRGFSLRPAEAGADIAALDRFYAGLAPVVAAMDEPVAGVFRLADLAAALALARDPGRRGRVILDLAE